jgi:tetratricopeptide (TPR) repeat protein
VNIDGDRGADEVTRSSQGVPARVVFWWLLAVAIVSLWVLRPVLANGFVNWDDQGYLAELVRMGRFSWSSLRWMWTSLQPFYLQPIVWMTHLADYRLWGLEPMGHHATNWLLHGAYVMLVGALVWLLTGKTGGIRPGERLAMSAVIALVCGIHPLQVESVAWVAARNGLLCSVWMVAALCAYVRAFGDDGKKYSWWWAAVGLHAVALLTKPFAVSLPLVMLGVDFFPLRRTAERSVWCLICEKWLMIALSGAAAVGAIAAQVHLEGIAESALGSRVLIAARGAVFYLWKLVWPAWLSPFYPLSGPVNLRSVEFLAPLLICIVVTVVAVWQRKRAPVLLSAWWSYLALLLPVCGLVQSGGQAVADRYAYLAMAPVLLALGSGALWIWRRGPVVKVALCAMVGAWLVFLGVRTREQIPVWRDDQSLWSALLSHFPNDPLGNFNLGLAMLRDGRLTEARVSVERAVAGSDPQARPLPMARATLGTIYLKTHAYDQAVEQLRQAIAGDGTLWAARYNLACAYARLGRLAEAYDVLRELVASRPDYATLAARDGELAALRADPEYAGQFASLVGGTGR